MSAPATQNDERAPESDSGALSRVVGPTRIELVTPTVSR